MSMTIEANMEKLHDIAGLYATSDVCLVIAVLCIIVFVLAGAAACYHMLKKPNRRNQGMSQFFTSIAACGLVVLIVPVIVNIVVDTKIDAAERSWAYEQVDTIETETGIKIPRNEREDIMKKIAAVLHDENGVNAGAGAGNDCVSEFDVHNALPMGAAAIMAEDTTDSDSRNNNKTSYHVTISDGTGDGKQEQLTFEVR